MTTTFQGDKKQMAQGLAKQLCLKYRSNDPKFDAQADLCTRLYEAWLYGLILGWLDENTTESKSEVVCP